MRVSVFVANHHIMKKLIIISLFISQIIQAQDSKQIKEVVISGAKRETEKKEIAQTIDVISKKDLKFNSASNTGDVLQNSGMITVQQSQNGGGSPVMRGFEANRLGIVVDGIRMNNAIFRGGHLQNVMRIDNGNLERIEVFYGAGSTLFGSDALGGVLNFITLRPQLNKKFSGNAFVRFASAQNEKSAGFTINYGKEKWASLTSFTYSDFGNLMAGNIRDPQYGNWGKRQYIQDRINGVDVMVINPNPNEQVNSSYSQYNILQKFLIQQSEKTSHLFNFQYSNSTDANRYDRLTEKVDNSKDADPITNKFTSAEWYYGPEARLMVAYTLIKVLRSEFLADKLNFTVAYQNYKESRNNRNFGNNNLRSQRENVDVFSINADLFKQIKSHQLTYGIEYNANWIASSVKRFNVVNGAESYATTRYPDGGAMTRSTAFYIQDIWQVTKDVAYINMGTRISSNEIEAKVSDTTRKYGDFKLSNYGYSANAGLSLLPTKSNKITLNFSTGFRTPNLDDVAKVYDNTAWIQVNDPNLKPELAMNYEINSWNKIGQNNVVEFGAYYTSLIDYIVNEQTSVNGNESEIINGKSYYYQRLGNAATAKVIGAYGSMKFYLIKNLELNGNLNYTYGRVKSNVNSEEKSLDHIPPMSARFALKYSIQKAQVELSVLMNSAKNTVDYSNSGEDNIDKSADPINGYTPDWSILNLKSNYELTKAITIQAALENIFDTHYRVFASGISSPGRSLRLTLRASF